MKQYLLLIVVAVIGGVTLGFGSPVGAADNLQIRPLQYRETLDVGQQKKGVVDIANGSDETENVTLKVQFFKQVSDDGTLQFFDDPDQADAITLDVDNVELKAKESARIGFTVDSSKLPQGDIFGVIFATTKHEDVPQTIVPSVQVGTLLLLQNGMAGPRTAAISSLNIGLFQFGSQIKGSVGVKNPANIDQATGFFPSMQVSVEPWGAQTKFEGPLVYAGRTRTFDDNVPSNQFGVYKVTVSANNAVESRYVFLITGIWRVVVSGVFVFLVLLAVGSVVVRKVRRGRVKKQL